MSTDVLIYVEDPGAANYISGLPAAFAGRGWTTLLIAEGAALAFLRERGIEPEPATIGAVQLLKREMPRVALIGTSENPDSLGLALVEQSRLRGVVSVGVVDGPANPDFRFRGRSDSALKYAPDWLLVPDRATRSSYVTLDYPETRIVMAGHPVFDRMRIEASRLQQRGRAAVRRSVISQASAGRPIVVFATEISTGLNPNQFERSADYSLEGRGISRKRGAVVVEEFVDAALACRPRPFLVLRLHPKDDGKDCVSCMAAFDFVSRGGPAHELLYAADLVVGMSSMILLEACLLGRPTLSILPRACEKAWLSSIAAGVTPCATTRDELRALLPQLVQNAAGPSAEELDAHFAAGAEQTIVGHVAKLLARTPAALGSYSATGKLQIDNCKLTIAN